MRSRWRPNYPSPNRDKTSSACSRGVRSGSRVSFPGRSLCSAPQPHGWCGVLAMLRARMPSPGRGPSAPRGRAHPPRAPVTSLLGDVPVAASVLLDPLQPKSSFNQKQQQNKRAGLPPNPLLDRPCPTVLVSSPQRDCSCLCSFWRLRVALGLWLHHLVSAHVLTRPSPPSGAYRLPLFIRMSVTSFRVPPVIRIIPHFQDLTFVTPAETPCARTAACPGSRSV